MRGAVATPAPYATGCCCNLHVSRLQMRLKIRARCAASPSLEKPTCNSGGKKKATINLHKLFRTAVTAKHRALVEKAFNATPAIRKTADRQHLTTAGEIDNLLPMNPKLHLCAAGQKCQRSLTAHRKRVCRRETQAYRLLQHNDVKHNTTGSLETTIPRARLHRTPGNITTCWASDQWSK